MTAAEIVAQLRMLIASIKEKASDGLTLAELGRIFLEFVQFAMETVKQFSVPGATKKEIVLQAVAELYDAVAPFLPLPWFLSPFRGLITSKLRAIILELTSGLIEAVYSRWPKDADPEPA